MALNIITRLLNRRGLRKLLSHGSKQYTAEVTSVNLIKNVCIPFSTVNHEHILRQFKYKTQNAHRYYATKPAQQNDIDDYRNEHNITVIGEDIPNPYIDIEKSEFPDYIKNFLKNQGFEKPTIIQSQGWPIALSGQNFVGIAQTGTGKTLAYLLPAVVHIKEKKARRGLGPIVLVLAPTRELARQIEQVAKDFDKSLGIRCVCVYGGASRSVQAEKMRQGVDILIATPGRLNDFIVSKTVSLSRSTYVVLDEADRMLDMGFEPQIREALEGVPLERQILMFSATWPKEVRHLAKEYLGEFVQVNVGSTELSANHNIKQHVHICDMDQKMDLFKSIMHDISGEGFGKILIFSNTKRFVDTLALTLRRNGWPADGIHGDKTQFQRDKIINKFKTGVNNILVATDVAARGLDVDGVTHVINYDFPNTSEDYIHRIGRTGRQTNKGVSHTLLTEDDGRQAKSLMEVLKEANQRFFKNWRALTARPPSLIGKLDLYGPLEEHMEQLRIFLNKMKKIVGYALEDEKLSFVGLKPTDPKVEALPEVALIDFLLQSKYILPFEETVGLHRRVDDHIFFFEQVWPVPTHYTPRFLYKLKADDSFVEPLPVMPWEIVKKTTDGDDEEKEEKEETEGSSSD